MKNSQRLKVLIISLVLIIAIMSASAAANNVDMDFKNAPLADVFQVLGELAGHNVLIDPSVTGTVSFYLKDLSVEAALDLVSKTTGYGYEIVNNTLVVASSEKLQREFMNTEFIFIVLDNVDVNSVSQLVRVIFSSVSTYVDPEYNVIVLYGLSKDVNEAKALIEQYDAISKGFMPMQTDQQQERTDDKLTTKQISVKHSDGSQIVSYLSQNWPHYEFTWISQLQMISARVEEEQWGVIQAVVVELDIPDFVLKGIVQSSSKTLALVEYKGVTQLIELGQAINGWVLKTVSDKEAVFSQGDRDLTIEMRR